MHFSDEKSNILRFETDSNTNNKKLSAFFRCFNEFRQVDNEFLKLYMPCPQNKHAQNEISRTINIEASNSISISMSMCAMHFEWNIAIWFEQFFQISYIFQVNHIKVKCKTSYFPHIEAYE